MTPLPHKAGAGVGGGGDGIRRARKRALPSGSRPKERKGRLYRMASALEFAPLRGANSVVSKISFVSADNRGAPIGGAPVVGGGCGIRTHAPFPANGFQDRLVMTASITLRKIDLLGFQDPCPSENIVATRVRHRRTSSLLVFVTRFAKKYAPYRFCLLTRYDRFDNPP